MQSLKRDITSGLALSAVALAIALAWGSPFVSPRAAYAEGAQPQVVRQREQSQPAQTPKAKPRPGTVGQRSQR
jgi:hypothetical protein